MLLYMLGHNPAEFGMVPSSDGFVPMKELLKAIHEEPGWHCVRESHINEVLLGKDRFLFDMDHDHIRTKERRWRMALEPVSLQDFPKILFAPVRRRAHPVVMEKGLRPAPGKYLVLSPHEEMALRIGKRRAPKPVLLRIESAKAMREGISFYLFGVLYLCNEVPVRYISGPPVAKENLKVRQGKEPQIAEEVLLTHAFSAGTFPLDLDRDPAPHRRNRGKKAKGWKESARKMRRKKR